LRAEGGPVVVATYLLAPGYFSDKIAASAGAAGAAAVSAPLGAAPEVADVVAQRYLSAIPDRPSVNGHADSSRAPGHVLFSSARTPLRNQLEWAMTFTELDHGRHWCGEMTTLARTPTTGGGRKPLRE
jgi:hypothetical protein